jgi:putative tricarboxylic transport membrane protein
MEPLLHGITYVFTPVHFLFLVMGTGFGILVGAIPGLSGSTGIILMLPFLPAMEPAVGLLVMSGIFCGSMFGGSISSILISTPGTPSGAATVLDGYPMGKRGEAGRAIGIALVASTIGGSLSALSMIFISRPLAAVALQFGPDEYFALMVFGLTVIASVSGASLVKGLLSGFFGLLIGLVGMDEVSGYARFTFGSASLMSGFPMLPVLIGVFAVSQVFSELGNVGKGLNRIRQKIRNVLPRWSELRRLLPVILPSSLIGVFIGVVPGAGGSIASWIAYNEAKRFSKDPDSFGKGNPAGIAAPEAANNGCTGGDMVPMLTLGIPGDVITAVMLGAMILIGIRPGPLLFAQRPEVINSLYVGFFMAQLIMFGLGLASARLWPRLLLVPPPVLFPIVLAICFVGTFSANNAVSDLMVALVFGVVGYFVNKHGFSPAALILGVILGPLAERELGSALIISHGNWAQLFRSPLALVFHGLSVLSIAYSIARSRMKRKGAPA